MRIKKLLLELDPHKDNDTVLQRARTVATRFGADVEVVVCAPPQVVPATALTEPGVIVVARQDSAPDFENWAREKVADLIDAGIRVSVTVSAEEPRYEAILAQADQCEADLIMRVVGEQSRLKRLFLGATDWDLIRHSKQPLWLVQPGKTGERHSNVLVAVDPTHSKDTDMKLDKRLLDFGKVLGDAISGSVHVYHAIRHTPALPVAEPSAWAAPPEPQPDPNLLDEVKAAHKTKLDELLAERGVTEDRVHMLVGEPTDQIGDVIGSQGIGVVVAGAISRSWLDRLIVGSTAESLLDAVNCDLVLLKADS